MMNLLSPSAYTGDEGGGGRTGSASSFRRPPASPREAAAGDRGGGSFLSVAQTRDFLSPGDASDRRSSSASGRGRADLGSRRGKRPAAVTSWRSVVKTMMPASSAMGRLTDNTTSRRKSFSATETIETFDKENNPLVRLEEQIKLQHLEELQNEFDKHKPEDIRIPQGPCRPDKIEKRTPGCMNLKEFQDVVAKVLGTYEYNDYLEKLFTKLDTSCDGYVDWEEFLTYMMLLYRENDYLRTKKDKPFQVEAVIRHMVQNRQEATVKILAVDAPTRYITISKEGAMTVWQPNMAFEKTYTVASDEGDTNPQKRRFKMWVTDAVYMRNCMKIAIGSTGRDIRFYDVSTNQYFEEFHLCSMSDVPYCFDYWYDPKVHNAESMLMFGVDTGAIHLLYFLQPVTQLFETPFKSDGGAQKISMQELSQHGKFVRHVLLPDVHPDLIRQIRYMPDSDSIISSSASAKSSIVICDTQNLKKSYIFKIEKGVEHFDHSKNLNILVTGSMDHLVRLWNPYVPNKAVAILAGHATGVIGVAIHEGFLQVFSYSKDAVIKVWDIKEHTILQSVILQFPSSLHSRMPEHGQFPLHLQPSPHDALLVTCNDYLGMLKMGRAEVPSDNVMATTHDTQLCCAIYNTFFNQVVTGCDSSAIAVWDIDTGNKAIVFNNAHGDEEITSMVFDETMRRLISGARNGTIKVWNFQNGHNLHKLEPAIGEAEVTGIMPILDKKVILSVGWSRLLTVYDDSDADNTYVAAQYNWKGGQLHRDDILTCDYCPPQYVATAGFDGEIIVWDLETEKVFARLRKGQPTNIRKQLEELQRGSPGRSPSFDKDNSSNSRPSSRPPSRPNSRHRTSHKVPSGQPVPVDKLLFLRGRANVKHSVIDKSILVSSEAGVIKWWNIFSNRPETGFFYAPDVPDESVLAMCSKPNNSILITGDTQGIIKVWDIMEYCVKQQDRRVKTPPPLEYYWKAHDLPVVSVEYIQHDAGEFVLSASTDKTARLWTPDGQYVGTFGQSKSWILSNPKTWAHPKTPWSGGEEKSKPKEAEKADGEADGHKTDEEEEADVPEDTAVPETATDEEWDGEESMDGTDTESVGSTSSGNKKMHEARPKTVAVVRATKQSKLPGTGLRLKYRSQTFPFDFDRSKTFLGCKVERELERKQRDRQGRRHLYGEIEVKQTARFGKLCSPYQALATPTFEDIRIPEHLPLSQRMINKGYSSNQLTVEAIQGMDFSYGGPDIPPSREQGNASATPSGTKKPSIVNSTPSTSRMSEDRQSNKLPPIAAAKSARSSYSRQSTSMSRQNTALGTSSRKWPTVVFTHADP